MVRRTAAFLLAATLALPARADLGAQSRQVESIRNASFKTAVRQKTISRSELRGYLESQFRSELPVSIDDYIESLRALKLIANEPNPVGKLLDLYQSQVVAFYDPAGDIYYYVGPPPGMEGAEMLQEDAITIHELTHALQDQTFGAGERIEKIKEDWDAQMAYHAVLEGEATLVMLGSVLGVMGVDLKDALSGDMMKSFTDIASSLTSTSVPQGTPPYFVSSLTFPYLEGLPFVVARFKEGGWKALDELHRNPPRSTAELLHPELYGKMKRPSDLVPMKGSTVGSTLGEFHWKFLLGEVPARGWVGDRVDLMKNGKGEWTVFADTRWTDAAEAKEFAEALKGKFSDAHIRQTGSSVRFAYGADAARIKLFVPPAK